MRLRVRIKNALYMERDRYTSAMDIPEYHDYEGEVLKKPDWLKPNKFALSTGNPKLFRFRVLDKDSVMCGWLIKE